MTQDIMQNIREFNAWLERQRQQPRQPARMYRYDAERDIFRDEMGRGVEFNQVERGADILCEVGDIDKLFTRHSSRGRTAKNAR